jgi:uncharacterized protein with PQ loop repeat
MANKLHPNGIKSFSYLQALTFIKATAWVMLGIGSLFISPDLAAVQSDKAWMGSLIRFGLAALYLFVGIAVFKNHQNIRILFAILVIDLLVCVQQPIGLFDVLMILFSLVIFWLSVRVIKDGRNIGSTQ